MGIYSMGKSLIKSNSDAAKNTGLGRLFLPQNDLGIKRGYDSAKTGMKDLQNAEQIMAASPKGKKKWEAVRDAAAERGDAFDVEQANAMLAHNKNQLGIATAASPAASKQVGGGIGEMWKGTRGYFTGADLAGQDGRTMAAAARIGAAGAAYMGVNGGLRYLSGGGMTYNNQGERDIAGIPFI